MSVYMCMYYHTMCSVVSISVVLTQNYSWHVGPRLARAANQIHYP